MSLSTADWNTCRTLLCALENTIRDAVIGARLRDGADGFSAIAEVSEADTIYAVDKISEEAIFSWFAQNWPAEWPVQVIMEGIDDNTTVVFPERAKPMLVCILDPIDGTRNIMYDKRSAWIIGGLGPIPADRSPRLRDLKVAAMTELPVLKQTIGDQISGVRGCGPEGLVRERVNLLSGERKGFTCRPSAAKNLKHGFSCLVKFFPEGKELVGKIEESLWKEIFVDEPPGSPMVFDDQYIATAGQFYEIFVGHDRFIADLRPLVFNKLGLDNPLVCHPYDVAAMLLLEESGALLEDAYGHPLDGPLDTVSPIAWVGFSNKHIADQVRPVLHRLRDKYLG
ncbi:MAG: inositol monophosphatase [Opitutales bacterium]|nr:inositol monophosphatase [Opitutales bacterium]MCH8541044.1 inositol monophosphatase [Opitutales bacterium]